MKKSCFVICPIGDDGSEARKRSDLIYDKIVEPVFDEFEYEVDRADKIRHSGKITTQIVNKILSSDMVVADLTDGNPNVYYELAIRHAIRKPFIQIAQDGTKIPFDLADMRTIFYDTDLERGLNAIENLKGFLKEIEDGNIAKYESPISQTIDVNALGNSGDATERLVADLFNEIKGIKMQIQDINRSGIESEYQTRLNEINYESSLKELKRKRDDLSMELYNLQEKIKNCSSKKDSLNAKSQIDGVRLEITFIEHQISELSNKFQSQKQFGK